MPYSAANPYTGKEAKVLMSFSMAGMGSLFGTWLRRMIMTKRHYASVTSVYMDNIAMREYVPANTQDRAKMFFQRVTPTALSADNRFTGITYFGAQNPNWNLHYKKAMSEAHTMIFAITDGWLESLWCGKEWSQYINESGRRPANRPLRAVLLAFAQDSKHDKTFSSLASANAPNITVLAVTKVNGVMAGATEPGSHVGGWAISNSDLNRVLHAIPAD